MALHRLAAFSGGEPRPMSRYRCAQRGQGVKTTPDRLPGPRIGRWQEGSVIRGIVAGLFWGAVLGGAGLVVVSATSPLPVRPAVTTPSAAEPVAEVPPPVVAPAAPSVVEVPAPTQPGPDAAPVTDTPVSETPAPAGGQTATPPVDAPVAETPVVTEAPAPVPAGPDVKPEAEAIPAPSVAEAPAAALPRTAGPDGAPAFPAAEDRPQGRTLAVPAAPAPDAAGTAAVLEPVPPQTAEVPAGLTGPSAAEVSPVVPAADPVPAPAPPVAPARADEERMADGPQVLPVPPVLPEPGVVPDPAPAAPVVPGPRPQPGFAGTVEGVRTGRLPSIAAAGEATVEAAAGGALLRNARAFDNPEGKPPFAILLLDDATAAVDLVTVAASPLPLTLVVDPAAPGAAARAAQWRAAGQEVALLASGLPRRGSAADMEVAMEALAAEFPDALAVTDLPDAGVQGDRAWATAVVPALAARGFGLVTWDQGLNTADQVARREGLPAVMIFRDLDGKDEAAPVIRRYLDRAAFKAQQDGRAVVMGRLRAETLAAVLEWALEGRAATLGLAPLSAVFPN